MVSYYERVLVVRFMTIFFLLSDTSRPAPLIMIIVVSVVAGRCFHTLFYLTRQPARSSLVTCALRSLLLYLYFFLAAAGLLIISNTLLRFNNMKNDGRTTPLA